MTDNPPIRIYVNRIENRVLSQTFNAWNNERLASTKNKIGKAKNGENMLNLEITKLVLIHCNIIKNDYQHDLSALHTFVSNKSFG